MSCPALSLCDRSLESHRLQAAQHSAPRRVRSTSATRAAAATSAAALAAAARAALAVAAAARAATARLPA